mmetsp:Transcript_714/g.2019  ORF Transcript_714/g.2019 Transcript_714/m.2019 type:complete len:260 (+) Transcript_714:587-1366(+)
MQRELGLVINVDLHRRLHELAAHRADGRRQRGGEHHDLLVMRSAQEDLLHIPSHVKRLQHLVTLVNDEVLDLVDLEGAFGDESLQPAGGAHHDVGRVGLEQLAVLGDGDTAVEDTNLDAIQVLAEAVVLLGDLEGQLARVADHQHAGLAILGLQLVQRGQHEHRRLAHTRLGLADHVHAQHRLRDAHVLHFRRVLEAALGHRAHELRLEDEIAEPRRMDAHVVTLLDVLCLALRLGAHLLLLLVEVDQIVELVLDFLLG